jgi:hypothetical protein
VREQVAGDAAAIYRSAMTLEMRQRERSTRSELADRETELRAVAAQVARTQQALREAQQGEEGRGPGRGHRVGVGWGGRWGAEAGPTSAGRG